jgi:DNA-binding NarL/FixJ family response regulator
MPTEVIPTSTFDGCRSAAAGSTVDDMSGMAVSRPDYPSLLPALLAAPDSIQRVPRSARDWAVDIACFVLAVVFGGFMLFATSHGSPPPRHPPRLPDVVVGVLGCLALWGRRRRPVELGVALGALSVVSATVAGAACIALFTVAVHRPFRTVALVALVHLVVNAIYTSVFPDPKEPYWVGMDIRMPRMDGLAATEALRARKGAPEIIILTTFDADEHVLRALRAGAAGFLLKDTPPGEIINAIRRVAAGEPMLSPSVTRRLIAHVAHTRPNPAQERLARLSDREREVVIAIGQGKSNAEISSELYMSVATVKAHVSRLLAKLELNNRVQVALLAHDAGLV